MKRFFAILLICSLLPMAALADEPETKMPPDGHIPAKGVTTVDGILLVNQNFVLPASYDPFQGKGDKSRMLPIPQQAFLEMQAAAQKEAGIPLFILSGFRSYATQASLYQNYYYHNGSHAENFSAHAGASEHQSGLAADIGDARNPGITLEPAFGATQAGIWLANNSYRFGFILRYPLGKKHITGYQYEPWHFRYVGKELALQMQQVPHTTLEEWFGVVGNLDRALAKPAQSTLTVDDHAAKPESYLINNNHFYQLRGLSEASQESKAAFTVSYHNDTKEIEIIPKENRQQTDKNDEKQTGKIENNVGKSADEHKSKDKKNSQKVVEKTSDKAQQSAEKEDKGDQKNRENETIYHTAVKSTSTLLIQGQKITLDTWNIGGHTYVKLRDIAPYIKMHVAWDGAKKIVKLTTENDTAVSHQDGIDQDKSGKDSAKADSDQISEHPDKVEEK